MVPGGVGRKPKNQKPIFLVPTHKESRLIDQAHLWRPRGRTFRDRNYFPRGRTDHLGRSPWCIRPPPAARLTVAERPAPFRTRATGREPERQQPFLDLGALEVLPDLAIEPRDHLYWRA